MQYEEKMKCIASGLKEIKQTMVSDTVEELQFALGWHLGQWQEFLKMNPRPNNTDIQSWQ
jgi:hypothetical protein